MKLGTQRVASVNIAGTGKNALDFHLAFYLGEILANTPAARCVIVSKDKGFALLDQARRQGLQPAGHAWQPPGRVVAESASNILRLGQGGG